MKDVAEVTAEEFGGYLTSRGGLKLRFQLNDQVRLICSVKLLVRVMKQRPTPSQVTRRRALSAGGGNT